MIKVQLKSGETLSYDLLDKDQEEKWKKDSRNIEFQTQITAIGIIFNSQWFSLPLPKRFRQCHFEASLVESNKENAPKYTAEQVRCYADDVLISVKVYWGRKPKMSRVDIVRVGRRRFNPGLNMR